MTPPPSGPNKRDALIRNDGAHFESLDDGDLFDGPSVLFGVERPELFEKLGELDDVVFEAIAGRGAAVDRLRVLWPEAVSAMGTGLTDESREAYLRHALSKWQECAEADAVRNPRIAITLMEVLAILLDPAIPPRYEPRP